MAKIVRIINNQTDMYLNVEQIVIIFKNLDPKLSDRYIVEMTNNRELHVSNQEGRAILAAMGYNG